MTGNVVLLIPAYNSAGTIECTLRSIQAQGEALCRLQAVYLADNCSTDATVAVAKATWTAETPLWVRRSESNIGHLNNANRGFTELGSRAEWLIVLHADDEAKPGWLATMLDEIASSGPEVASVCCSYDCWFPDGRIAPGEDSPARPTEVIVGSRKVVRDTLLNGCWWMISGCAIRVAAFEAIGPFDQGFTQAGDWEWLLRCLSLGWTVRYVPRTLIRLRQHPQSISSASMQLDHDVADSLRLAQRYTDVMSRRDLVRFHALRGGFLARRMLRAALRRRGRRLVAAARMFGRSGQSLVHCLALAGRPAAADASLSDSSVT